MKVHEKWEGVSGFLTALCKLCKKVKINEV